MAKDKKGFLLYADYLELIENLDDAEAGKLFKIILNYVNDKNPEVEDKVLKMAFLPIKMQLKRDLKQYESICVKRSESGKLGGRPSKPKQNKQMVISESKISKPKQLEAKKPDIENDSDNDNEIDNETETVSMPMMTLSEIKERIVESPTLIINNCKKYGVTEPVFLSHVDRFILHLGSKDIEKKHYKEFLDYLSNWSRINPPSSSQTIAAPGRVKFLGKKRE